jgi:hypothetical protein
VVSQTLFLTMIIITSKTVFALVMRILMNMLSMMLLVVVLLLLLLLLIIIILLRL